MELHWPYLLAKPNNSGSLFMCAGANPFPSIQPGLATPTPSLGSWGGAGVGFFLHFWLFVLFVLL